MRELVLRCQLDHSRNRFQRCCCCISRDRRCDARKRREHRGRRSRYRQFGAWCGVHGVRGLHGSQRRDVAGTHTPIERRGHARFRTRFDRRRRRSWHWRRHWRRQRRRRVRRRLPTWWPDGTYWSRSGEVHGRSGHLQGQVADRRLRRRRRSRRPVEQSSVCGVHEGQRDRAADTAIHNGCGRSDWIEPDDRSGFGVTDRSSVDDRPYQRCVHRRECKVQGAAVEARCRSCRWQRLDNDGRGVTS